MTKTLSRISLCIAVAFASTACGTVALDNNLLGQALAKGTQAMSLTNAQIAQYVTASVQQMDAQNTVAPASSAYTKRLKRLTRNFTSVNGTPLNFKVYVTDDINAFACADGSVRVYTGIMDMMTDDELLGIIGHEIGHVANEDSKDAFKQALLNSALSDVISSTGSTAAAITQGQLGQLANAMVSSKYSRKQENEADAYGYNFLKQHGRNPYNMVLAFEKMQALEQNSGASRITGAMANMFSSHPQTSDRIKKIKAMCERDGYSRPAR